MYSRRTSKRTKLAPLSKFASFATEMPVLVVQEMKPEFVKSCLPGKTNFKYQGGLHPLHSDSIARVHLVHPCRRQLYAIKDLHGHPHYSISPDDLSLFRKHCSLLLDSDSSLVEYSASLSHDDDPFLKVWNEGTPEFQEFAGLFKSLELRKSLLHILLSSAKHANVNDGRNNLQASFGVSSLNTRRNVSDGIHEAKPQMNTGTEKIARYLVTVNRKRRTSTCLLEQLILKICSLAVRLDFIVISTSFSLYTPIILIAHVKDTMYSWLQAKLSSARKERSNAYSSPPTDVHAVNSIWIATNRATRLSRF
jgi:hypothetical protein